MDKITTKKGVKMMTDIITPKLIEKLCEEQPRKMQGLLPEIIKRLIISSANNLTSIRIPDKEDIWAPGFDGVIECNEQSTYINAGKSVWEFGTNGDSIKKINSDYEKRTRDSLGLKPQNTSFYLVTPRIWAFDNQGLSITKWESEHNDWKSVRVYDGSVLSDWLNSCPNVAAWFWESFYDEKILFSSIQAAWSWLSKYTSPALVPMMFINGRSDEKTELYNLIKEKRIIKVKSKTQIDAFGFCIAALLEDKELSNRVIVVDSEEAYKSLSTKCKDKVFLLKPMEISSFIDGNTSIICYNNEAPSIQPDIELSPLRRIQIIDSFRKMGIPQTETDNLYYHTHGELLAIIRRIPGNSNIIKPKWSNSSNNRLLFPILFLRTINVNNQTDKRLCEVLAETSFDDILSAYNDYLHFEDSPVKRIEDVYSIVSCEEAWRVLSPDINCIEYKRLVDTLLLILNIYSGKTENSLQLGYGSSRYFYTLSLNLLLYAYDYNDNNTLSCHITSILDKLWEHADLFSSLRLYAEVGPANVMSLFDKDYYTESSKIKRIFSDGGYTSHYTDILSALEHLATVNETKIKACNLLFSLCSIQTQYYYSTTPEETLLDALWFYNTESELRLSEKVKLALKYLDDNILGTKLVYALIIKDSAFKNIRLGSPQKQSFNFTYPELIDAIGTVSRALIEKALEREEHEIILQLISHFWALPPDILSFLLDSIHSEAFPFHEWIQICYTIRHKNRWYKENENEKYHNYILVFEDFITKIDEQEDDNYLFCLFYGKYYDYDMLKALSSDTINNDYGKMDRAAKDRRIESLDFLYDKDREGTLSTLLKLMNDGGEWGQVLAQSKYLSLCEKVCEIANAEKKYSIVSGFLNEIDPNKAYQMIISFSEEEQKMIIPRIYNNRIGELIDDEWMRTLFWSNKIMREYNDAEYNLLLQYNPNGLLPYYVYLNKSSILENKATIFTILSAIISKNIDGDYAFGQDTDAFNRIFTCFDNDGYYSDEYAEMCLYLSKYNYHYQFHECAKLFYFHHPERICSIINTGKDDYVNVSELLIRYELPRQALDNYGSLSAFIEAIIHGTNAEHRSTLYKFIGTIIAKAMKNKGTHGNTDIQCKIVENYHNNDFDTGFIDGYRNLYRTLGDGSDQKEEYAQLVSEAEDIEIDYSHSAFLLRQIAKEHLFLSKHDYIISELGDYI